MAAIRLKVPATAQIGEIIEIKAMIQHDMESGYRVDERGEPIAQNILSRFECTYNGETIFAADFSRGVSANPLIGFYTTAMESGTLTFTWYEETGETFSKSQNIVVS